MRLCVCVYVRVFRETSIDSTWNFKKIKFILTLLRRLVILTDQFLINVIKKEQSYTRHWREEIQLVMDLRSVFVILFVLYELFF